MQRGVFETSGDMRSLLPSEVRGILPTMRSFRWVVDAQVRSRNVMSSLLSEAGNRLNSLQCSSGRDVGMRAPENSRLFAARRSALLPRAMQARVGVWAYVRGDLWLMLEPDRKLESSLKVQTYLRSTANLRTRLRC
mmetsp:Transcript_6685/g.9722  ORF Transcript_6685/g.9722 Transcript_6685/m.9722 type:complete len:136 (-) Transcript_6685:170-577(-)